MRPSDDNEAVHLRLVLMVSPTLQSAIEPRRARALESAVETVPAIVDGKECAQSRQGSPATSSPSSKRVRRDCAAAGRHAHPPPAASVVTRSIAVRRATKANSDQWQRRPEPDVHCKRIGFLSAVRQPPASKRPKSGEFGHRQQEGAIFQRLDAVAAVRHYQQVPLGCLPR